MPTTIMRHLGRGAHPGSSAVQTEHYFESLVTTILRRYWIRHIRKDLKNILLLQGQFCSRRLWQMSEVLTHDTREQALLQGPKAPEFVSTLL